MKFHLLLVCLIVASTQLSYNLAEVTVGTYSDSSHPGQCVLQDMVMKPGTVARHPDKCAKITCHAGSKASIVTCAAMIPPPDCKLGDAVDPTSIYPNCCRRKIICKNGMTFNS